jgi:hypothetical protein
MKVSIHEKQTFKTYFDKQALQILLPHLHSALSPKQRAFKRSVPDLALVHV